MSRSRSVEVSRISRSCLGCRIYFAYVCGNALLFLQAAMQGFTEKIVGMMKSEELFASQGGPIILSQASVA